MYWVKLISSVSFYFKKNMVWYKMFKLYICWSSSFLIAALGLNHSLCNNQNDSLECQSNHFQLSIIIRSSYML